ncbi:hypothetical protein CDEST_04649 [Colletotrichum destructivum]|uniref:Uncharacterized protein n=1 Tax=Colletotrichum destructivum TaxID=34406 RepID=A0AAX4I9H8_9PEZI|nr:hypothetical protein CDEST_04649 [Colletotrichum destructivum]
MAAGGATVLPSSGGLSFVSFDNNGSLVCDCDPGRSFQDLFDPSHDSKRI